MVEINLKQSPGIKGTAEGQGHPADVRGHPAFWCPCKDSTIAGSENRGSVYDSGVPPLAGLEPLKCPGSILSIHQPNGNKGKSFAAKKDRAEQAVQLYPSAGRLGHFLAHAPTCGPGDSHVFREDDEVAWAGTPNDWADTVEFQTPDGAAKVPA